MHPSLEPSLSQTFSFQFKGARTSLSFAAGCQCKPLCFKQFPPRIRILIQALSQRFHPVESIKANVNYSLRLFPRFQLSQIEISPRFPSHFHFCTAISADWLTEQPFHRDCVKMDKSTKFGLGLWNEKLSKSSGNLLGQKNPQIYLNWIILTQSDIRNGTVWQDQWSNQRPVWCLMAPLDIHRLLENVSWISVEEK